MSKFLGDQGEKIVGDKLGLIKNTKMLEQSSFIPDFINRVTRVIYEVKNVSSLASPNSYMVIPIGQLQIILPLSFM